MYSRIVLALVASFALAVAAVAQVAPGREGNTPVVKPAADLKWVDLELVPRDWSKRPGSREIEAYAGTAILHVARGPAPNGRPRQWQVPHCAALPIGESVHGRQWP